VLSTAKDMVGLLATPVMVAILIAIMAVIARMRGSLRAGRTLAILAATLGYVSSLGPVGNALIRPLETVFTPLRDGQIPRVKFIVVLGSSYAPRDGIPVTAALDQDGLARIVEGIRLWRLNQDARLVVSGGPTRGEAAPAQGYAKLAESLGVSPSAIVALDHARDTSEEARAVARVVGQDPFLLVTSAFHLPRAMKLMERAGTRPIPAPANFMSGRITTLRVRDLLPDSAAVRDAELATHEYLGLLTVWVGAQ